MNQVYMWQGLQNNYLMEAQLLPITYIARTGQNFQLCNIHTCGDVYNNNALSLQNTKNLLLSMYVNLTNT